MVLTPQTITAATQMGQRAAQHFRDTGLPTRNPFPSSQPDLAAAWRNGYFRTDAVAAAQQ